MNSEHNILFKNENLKKKKNKKKKITWMKEKE